MAETRALMDRWRALSTGVQLVVVLAVLVLVIVAAYLIVPQDRPGSPAVYDRIESMSDCQELQESFDLSMNNHRAARSTAESRWTLAYAEAAEKRMAAIGCYG